ncbi:omptin family outer membrane protease [Pedobacter alluvionis]|uniref:Omptin family outer membrane protease n=1 Tax=Pedobacter alluvionis TaxID=475253 RepID=A0A497Y5K6_9SPHI|nr:omptin family outer membrane protease [Pedobacter alluvionis]RLJ77450.1 omptin family protein [Pedobacter alluvionis]TFB33336.1 omptin family outer membrane protease [Pedobacter alluvionis]
MQIALRISLIKQFLACSTLILFCKVVSAQDTPHRWSVKPYIGLQQSKFDWSIAGNAAGANPNVLSELIWKNLKGPGFGLDIKYNITRRLSVKATNQYSNITKGEAEDTDYADDNRQNAFYFDLLNANKGYLYDAALQLNYQLLKFGQFNINPIVGLSYNQQKFYLLESANNPDSKGLNSTYQARYKGFDFGAEFIFITNKFSLGATILAGFYNYSAKANWNLIPDFAKPVSFTHKANSFSLSGDINLAVPVSKSLRLEVDYKINNINTYSGVDKAYFNSRATEETQFNGANFRKNAVLLGLNLSF